MSTRRRYLRASNRRGIYSLELLFAVPVLAAVLLATLHCGRTMMVRSGVTHAATLAAREAAKGGDIAQVTETVNGVLAAYNLAVADKPGSAAKLTLHDGRGTSADCGDPSMAASASPAIRGDEILVSLAIKPSARRTDGRRLAPLSNVFGSSQAKFFAGALVKREQGSRPATSGSPRDNTQFVAAHDAMADEN